MMYKRVYHALKQMKMSAACPSTQGPGLLPALPVIPVTGLGKLMADTIHGFVLNICPFAQQGKPLFLPFSPLFVLPTHPWAGRKASGK